MTLLGGGDDEVDSNYDYRYRAQGGILQWQVMGKQGCIRAVRPYSEAVEYGGWH